MAPTWETGMALGLILIAMLGATGVTAALFAYGFPFWIVALAYPVTGSIILLPVVALFGWIRQHPPAAGPDAVSYTHLARSISALGTPKAMLAAMVSSVRKMVCGT